MARSNKPKPWERKEKETVRAYEAFCVYRDMGPERSIAKTGQKLGKNTTTLSEWSSRNDWVKRAAAWDDEQDKIAREIAQKEMANEIRRMRKRQAEAGKFMQIKAIKALNRIAEEDIKPGDISRLVDIGSKLERLARGDVGEVIEERQGEAVTPAVQFYMPSNGRDQHEELEEEEC